MRTLTSAIVTLTAATVALTMGAPVAASAPATVPNGSCETQTESGAIRSVRFAWTSRRIAWRVRPAFAKVFTRGMPNTKARVNGAMTQETEHTGIEAWYFIIDARQVNGVCWFRVRLPAHASSRGGWVQFDDTIIERTNAQIEIDLSERRVKLYRGLRLRVSQPIVIGKRSTPTPTSRVGEPFAMYDAKQGSASDFTGTWQLATTAYSKIDRDLGRIGIHGRGGKSLRDPLGSAASNGCLRASNAGVNQLVRMLPIENMLGVPVVITL